MLEGIAIRGVLCFPSDCGPKLDLKVLHIYTIYYHEDKHIDNKRLSTLTYLNHWHISRDN